MILCFLNTHVINATCKNKVKQWIRSLESWENTSGDNNCVLICNFIPHSRVSPTSQLCLDNMSSGDLLFHTENSSCERVSLQLSVLISWYSVTTLTSFYLLFSRSFYVQIFYQFRSLNSNALLLRKHDFLLRGLFMGKSKVAGGSAQMWIKNQADFTVK